MMNTVPKEALLSGPIVSPKWKLKVYKFTISIDEFVSISGTLRVISLLFMLPQH
jgi:hypothetical protein